MDPSKLAEVVETVEEAVAGIEGRDMMRSSSVVLDDASLGECVPCVDCAFDTTSSLFLRTRWPRSDFRCSIQLDGLADDEVDRLVRGCNEDLRSCCFCARLRN